jgi:hypothetical protein
LARKTAAAACMAHAIALAILPLCLSTFPDGRVGRVRQQELRQK